jgi:hypothetical protein
MRKTNTDRALTLPRLCGWALGYAFRRGWPLAGVAGSQLLRVALDVLKPWPMVFLIDYVLRGHAMPPLVARIVEALPSTATPANLIGWSVAGTVVLFLVSWLAVLNAGEMPTMRASLSSSLGADNGRMRSYRLRLPPSR